MIQRNLQDACKSLHLSSIMDHYDEISFETKEQFLRDIFNIELESRQTKKVASLIKKAKFRELKWLKNLFRIYDIICTKRIFSMIHNYTSNISREQFELIREDLENARKRTRPRTVDLYEVFCGVLYVLTTGCQWRNLPSDFPNWQTVYFYYQIWRKLDEKGISLLEKVHKKIS